MSSIPQPIAPTHDRILSNLLGLSSAYFAVDLREIPVAAPLPWFLTGIGRPATG